MLAQLLLSPAADAADFDTLTPARQREVLQMALNAYDEATAMMHSDPARASQLYRQSAAAFSALRDAGVRNAALEYNLGNSYYRLGDIGRAMLHYRRAERMDPTDARLAANLRLARQQVQPTIPPSGTRRLARWLLFWHDGTSSSQRWLALLACSAIGWGLMVAWLRWRRPRLLLTGLAVLAIAWLCGLSLIWQCSEARQRSDAVLVGSEQYLHRQRGAETELASEQPLGPGVEMHILQTRGEWVEIRLDDGQAGWLPADAVERV